jgi:ComF family protein
VPLRPVAGPLVPRLLDTLFPPRCVGCGRRGSVFCPTCIVSVRAPAAQVCAHCGEPLPSDAGGAEPVGLCARCQVGPPGPLTGLRVAARYEDRLRRAILALKYHRQRRVAESLGDLLAETGHGLLASVDLVIPVPLHARRQRERGFNQAELLARRCAARLGLPMRSDLLVRVRATPPQVRLAMAARHANVAGAFAATLGAPVALGERRVLLVDDVCTSGATLTATAGALRASGAATVWGLAVARPALDADTR